MSDQNNLASREVESADTSPVSGSTPVNRWSKPQAVAGIDIAFGGDMRKLLPPMKDIPEQFSYWGNPWARCVSTWFARGLKSPNFFPKAGIDGHEAMSHVKAILVSFEPKHEHKTAACAYLLSLWFDNITWDGGGVHPEDDNPTANQPSAEAKK